MARRGNNERSIFKRSDGRWASAITTKSGVGKSNRRTFYGRTRQEVAEKLTNALRADNDGLPLEPTRYTLQAYAPAWLSGRRHVVKPKTFEVYKSALRVHILPILGSKRLQKLSPLDVEQLYASLIGQGLSRVSVGDYHRVLLGMLEKAVRQGLLGRNVAKLVDLPRRTPTELPMWTVDQVQRFIRATEGHPLEALFIVAITTGARQGELFALRTDDVDVDAKEIRIRRTLQKIGGEVVIADPKTSKARRTVALTTVVVKSLRRHRAKQAERALRLGPAWSNNDNLLFTSEIGTPLDKTNVLKRQLHPLLVSAGLPKITFHSLRHIVASIALSEGTPVPVVSEMLGHSDASTMLRVYAHAVPGSQRQVADTFERLLAVG